MSPPIRISPSLRKARAGMRLFNPCGGWKVEVERPIGIEPGQAIPETFNLEIARKEDLHRRFERTRSMRLVKESVPHIGESSIVGEARVEAAIGVEPSHQRTG